MAKLFTKVIEHKAISRVKRHWLTLAFFFGFLLDSITLSSVEQLFDNVVLATYVVLAMLSLSWLYASLSERLPEKISTLGKKYAPVVVQFSFGGLLSGMLIFYGRSGDLWVSWPFILMILVVIYYNETIKDRAKRLLYNLAIFYIALFSYVVLIVPVLTGKMGPWVFVGSGFLALIIMYWFVRFLYRLIPRFMELQMRAIVFTLGIIFASFNFLYFADIIPPIPLSLKDVGIYHSVIRFENGDYQLMYEEGSWWQFFKDSDKQFHPRTGDDIFCFARVFTPTRLSVDIYHSWDYYDPQLDEWIERARIPYAIAGGNERGYRGYTLIGNYQDGTWRCSVETGNGQVLGRETFTVDSSEEPSELVTRVE